MALTLSMLGVATIVIPPGLSPDEEWGKFYTSSYLNYALSVRQTSNGGYIVAGGTHSLHTFLTNMTLIKTDPTGSMVWNKTFVATNRSWAVYTEETSDGGYMVIGGSLNGVVALKTDQNGALQWNRSYGISSNDDQMCATHTTDGGYGVAGRFLLKLDHTGKAEWNRTITNGHILCIKQTSDSGYILAGTTTSYDAYGDALLMKVNQSGGIQWNKTYIGLGLAGASSVQPTQDGGYLMVRGGLLVKVDTNGLTIWNKTFPSIGQGWLYSIQNTSDGGYALLGFAESPSYDYDNGHFWLAKLDSNANPEWQKILPERIWDMRCSLQQTSDGGYVFAGTAENAGDGKSFVGKVAGQFSLLTWTLFLGWAFGIPLTAAACIMLIQRKHGDMKIKKRHLRFKG